MTDLDKKLMDIIVSSLLKSADWSFEINELICEESGLAYPIKDGIPVMLPEEARKLTD